MIRKAELFLNTREETLTWLAANDESNNVVVCSWWLCDELNRFEKEGYIYNRQAQDRIASEQGLSVEQCERRVPGKHLRSEGGLLGSLVYYAQSFRRVRQLQESGWRRVSQTDLSPYIGQTLTAIANGELGGEIQVVVKKFNDRLRLCPPRSRTKAYADYLDWWVKLPAATTEPKQQVAFAAMERK